MLAAAGVLLSACGGGGGSAAASASAGRASPAEAGQAVQSMTTRDAMRLADQASFGATEALTGEIKAKGAASWVAAQMALKNARYTLGGGPAVHQTTQPGDYCDMPANAGANCWRDNMSTVPLQWDFYRNALNQPDQLRQRVAWALQQMVVVSSLEVQGTYGFRYYHNTLLDNAFGNYRQVLKKVALSPVMGDYLNNANNDKAAPNENFGRELLQLFSVGTCELNADGTPLGGQCKPTYDMAMVRTYAYALTGWTYPAGGKSPWNCGPVAGMNCRFYDGDMVAVPALHDTQARTLLSGVSLPAGHTAPQALEAVLDSLMQHPNTAPFVGKQLIQHLVSSNPSPAYVSRVASAFSSGRFQSDGASFGTGQKGDLAATVAAVLLDPEARGDAVGRSAGRLREPALMFTGVLRALGGKTDGEVLGWWWGGALRQHVFRSPSVFNFYPKDYPVAGTALVGPAFGIHSAGASFDRMNFLNFVIFAGGASADTTIPGAIGTSVDLSALAADADDAARLVDRVSTLATGQPLPGTARTAMVNAVSWWTATTDPSGWRLNRARVAAYLIFGSPYYQVQ